jgi:hypothetical protein
LGIEKINISELANFIRNNPKNEKNKSDACITYILLEKTIMIDDKIKAYGNRSAFSLQMKDYQTLNYTANKLINLYLKNQNIIHSDGFIICKALMRTAMNCINDNYLISLCYLNVACLIIKSLPSVDNENFNFILNYFQKKKIKI